MKYIISIHTSLPIAQPYTRGHVMHLPNAGPYHQKALKFYPILEKTEKVYSHWESADKLFA